MKMIKIYVSAPIRDHINNLAQQRGLTTSALMRELVNEQLTLVSGAESFSEIVGDTQNRKRISVGMPAHVYETVVLRAGERSMSISAWILALIRKHTHGTTVFDRGETVLLRENIRELAAIGRNVNQIARGFNRNQIEVDAFDNGILLCLRTALEENKDLICKTINDVNEYWGEKNA